MTHFGLSPSTVAENDRRKAENERERMELARTIEENRAYEAELAAKRMASNMRYQNDLQGQIHYNDQMREERRRNEDFEHLMGMQAEREYQEKLKNALDNPTFERLHPMRRAMLNQ